VILLNDILVKAVVVVTFALISYSIGVITEHRKRVITKRVLVFLTVGVILDISSTVLMIIGSGKIPITVHGFIGYSALLLMLVDTILSWSYRCKNGDKQISNGLNIYTKMAFGWWVVAYIVGAVMSATL
jgi:uncharacterized repeat protein (TIGR03987 family)